MKKFLKILTMTLATIAAATMFFACNPSSIEKATKKMEDAGYTVSDYTESNDAEGFQGGIIARKGGIAGIGGENIIAVLFDTKENAEAFHNDIKGIFQDSVVEGKWVYWGSEQAVEDFT